GRSRRLPFLLYLSENLADLALSFRMILSDREIGFGSRNLSNLGHFGDLSSGLGSKNPQKPRDFGRFLVSLGYIIRSHGFLREEEAISENPHAILNPKSLGEPGVHAP